MGIGMGMTMARGMVTVTMTKYPKFLRFRVSVDA
jgi:hypothetical protein